MSTISDLITRVRNRDERALARVISIIEDGGPHAGQCVEELFPFTGHGYIVGVTGAPGAGKSTLVDQLVANLAGAGKRVAVLAVDPSSPFTGGALLGDRIRMGHAGVLPGTFVRSMASRGALGGIAPRTPEVIYALDAAGYDVIIVETVGVGQGEVEIVRTADTVVVVLVPGMGDVVQAMKAGILEIADVFALNKADHEGIDRLQREITSMLSLAETPAWRPPVLQTVASQPKGIAELIAGIEQHRAWADSSGEQARRRRSFLKHSVLRDVAEISAEDILKRGTDSGLLPQLLEEVYARKRGPRSAAEVLIRS